MKKIKVGIIGAAGYTGAELIKLLLQHPGVELHSIVSRTYANVPLCDYFTELTGETNLHFSEEIDSENDLVFLCLPHGEAKTYLQNRPHLLKHKIIDLSRDFRSIQHANIHDCNFTYGLPELNAAKIKQSEYVANPGCFATAIQLGLLPLAQKGLLQSEICVNATTGSTGAGIKPSSTTHFSWRQNNASVYQAFEHAHNEEIIQSIQSLHSANTGELLFVPQRGSFTRGIISTSIVKCRLQENDIKELYSAFYASHPFTKIIQKDVDLKMVVNTNKCFIQLIKHNDHLLIISIIDNLLKGASGQAVQNMNLMLGWEETCGLQLKNSTY